MKIHQLVQNFLMGKKTRKQGRGAIIIFHLCGKRNLTVGESKFDHPYVANGLSEQPAGGVSACTNWESVNTSYAGDGLPGAAGNSAVPVWRAMALLLLF